MTRELLLKPSDHVIEVPGGIPASLEPVSRFLLLSLSSSPRPDHQSVRCTRHQRHFSEGSCSQIKHQY